MTIDVVHSTSYRYGCAVDLQPHTFRLRPRMTTTQRLLSFDLEVLPVPTGATECLDQDGNLAMHSWFGAPVEELRVTSRFRVELLRAWAEAYLPSAGWRGYKPSRGLVVADRHVAVAAAFHADLASPITGAFSGACGSRMETRLDMQADCS